MVLLGDKKFACATCIKGHRSSSCNHTTRALFAIRSKGRPVSQCEHCRELRKTKQVHVKCECESTSNGVSELPSEGATQEAPGPSLIVARKGARKVKTLEVATAAFPNGIQDVIDGAELLSSMSASTGSVTSPACTCKSNGLCNCCTPRYIPKSSATNESELSLTRRPPISLKIPSSCDGQPSLRDTQHRPASRSPNITITPISYSPGGTQQPSPIGQPHQHHALDGHYIGGTQNNHHPRHSTHYTPYSPNHAHHHHPPPGHSGGNSPCSPNSPANPSPVSPATSPVSGLPNSASSLLAPPMDFPYALQTSLMSISASMDVDRPRSANSAYSGTGPATPLEYTDVPDSLSVGSYFPSDTDWMNGRNEVAGNGYRVNRGAFDVGPGDSGTSVRTGSARGDPLSSVFGDGGSGLAQHASYDPVEQGLSPSRVSDYDPSRATMSPMSPFPQQHLGVPIPDGDRIGSSDTAGLATQTSLERQLHAMAAQGAVVPDPEFGAASPAATFGDEFDEDEQVLQRASAALLGLGHRRRGSHISVASSHGGSGDIGNESGVEIRLMSASPAPPALQEGIAIGGGRMLDHMQLLGIGASGSTCTREGRDCHCWTLSGKSNVEAERCNDDSCPCCGGLHNQFSDVPSSPAFGSAVGFNDEGTTANLAAAFESFPDRANRAALSGLPTAPAMSCSSPVDHYPFGLSPQAIPFLSRSRSSSSSSRISATSSSSTFSDLTRSVIHQSNTENLSPPASLSRANSTGSLNKQGHKYKSILPKPSDDQIHAPSAVHPVARSSFPASTGQVGLPTPSVLLPYKPNGTTHSPYSFPRSYPATSTMEGRNSSAPDVVIQPPMDAMDSVFYGQFNFMASSLQEAQSGITNPSEYSSSQAGSYTPETGFSSPNLPGGHPSHSRSHSHSSRHSVSSAASTSSLPIYPTSPILTNNPAISHGRSRSFVDASAASAEQSRSLSQGHLRSSSTSFLDFLQPNDRPSIELIVTPASPFGADSDS